MGRVTGTRELELRFRLTENRDRARSRASVLADDVRKRAVRRDRRARLAEAQMSLRHELRKLSLI